MKILGVSFLSDASAAVLVDGRLIAAVSEERINRTKLWNGIPHKSIEAALKLAGLTLNEIDCIATHGACPSIRDRGAFDEAIQRIERSSLSSPIKADQKKAIESRFAHESNVVATRTPQYLGEIKKYGKPMFIYGHHECHAATAFYGSGWDQCTVMTADGWGEDASSTLYDCDSVNMKRIAATSTIDSLGYFYGSITKALGFIPHRHEGKVLGLAAYCKEPRSYSTIRQMVEFDKKGMQFKSGVEHGFYVPRFENPRLQQFVKGFSREDVCSAAQMTLEEVVTECVSSMTIRNGRLALAGGIFANVKLNQRLAALANIQELYVFPNMGDGGLSVGAAYLAHAAQKKTRPKGIETMLLGQEFGSEEIANILRQSGLKFHHHENIAEKTADLLSQNKVVARFWGRMEFGPRALGSRSIMYPAREASVNDWLNRRLKRSEFMPFAPATLESDASSCYIGMEKALKSVPFMTTTVACTERMIKDAPAAVHVDGTARPQVISEKLYPDFYSILKHYKARSGSPTLINTSFNMHEEPIVCTPADAIRAIKDGDLPYLAIGDFLVENS